jgi:hypothetical protein
LLHGGGSIRRTLYWTLVASATVPDNTSKIWTPEEDELLKSPLEADTSVVRIAVKLKV